VNDVVFTIAPRINAAGRIESGKQAVELLISESHDEAKSHGEEINKKNTTRKSLNESITREALSLIAGDSGFKNRKSTVLYNPDWHKGVIGIVASKLTDEFYRPTIILTRSNGVASGSARSVKDFDIYNAIESCSDLLDQFGGHMYAAGLTLKEENIEAFKDRFEAIVSSTIEDRMLIREIEIDDVISLEDVNTSFFNVLKQFAPFGPGNMAPIFKSEEVYDRGSVRVVGNNHLKLSLIQKNHSRKVVDSIAFQLGAHYDRISQNEPFHVCYHVEENNFNGRTSLQLNIKDISFE
jgi:single-stranded-DNA-specific exonuclease